MKSKPKKTPSKTTTKKPTPKKKTTPSRKTIIINRNATSHIIQAISMTVQRGNAISIMGTLGPLRKLEDFFDVVSPQEELS